MKRNNTQPAKKNDPNANYAMYEQDREAKRNAQTITGEGNAPRLQVANATIDYYERRELDYIKQVRQVTAQRDELLAVAKFALESPQLAHQHLKAAIANASGANEGKTRVEQQK